MYNYAYLKNLETRRRARSLRSDVVFGQTVGWMLSLVAAFHYFILYEYGWWFVLMLGNGLLFLGIAIPESLRFVRLKMEKIASFVSTIILQILLACIYIFVVSPLGLLNQKLKGQTPFYYWHEMPPQKIEGWIPKVSSDQGHLVAQDNKILSSQFLQLTKHMLSNGELILMPSLLLILVLGLLAVFVQSSVIAPMIYTLF